MKEPELITILEGPTPNFHLAGQNWLYSIHEGPRPVEYGMTELRTNNGEDIRERCVDAWEESRVVQLDFPDEIRAREQVDVVAMRLEEADSGTILRLWVMERNGLNALSELSDVDDDEEDSNLDFPDDLPF